MPSGPGGRYNNLSRASLARALLVHTDVQAMTPALTKAFIEIAGTS